MKAWRVSLWFWWILHVGSLQGLLWEPLCKPGQHPGNQQGEQQIGGGKDYLGTNLVGTTCQEQLAGQPAPALASGKSQAQALPAESSGQEWQQGKDSAHGLFPVWSWEQEHWLLAMPRAASEASQLPQGMGRAQAWFCWEWPSCYWNLPESGSKPEWDAARRGFSMADTNALIFQRSLVASLEWAGTSRGNGIMFPSLSWIF